VDGIFVGEHLPLSAKQADKYTIVRSMTSRDSVHESAQAFFLTGHAPLPGLQYPAMGSIVSHELQPATDLPSYVITGDAPAAWEQAHWLGARHNAFAAGSPHAKNYKVRDLDLPMGVDWARMERRDSLRIAADNYFRQFDSANVIDSVNTHYRTALSLIRSERARTAFDIAAEPEKLRDRYGRSAMGQGCLVARRLVEHGVRFISVRSGGRDHHQDVFNGLAGTSFQNWTARSPRFSKTCTSGECWIRRWSSSAPSSDAHTRSTSTPGATTGSMPSRWFWREAASAAVA
jgi:hypothetical protein